MVQGVIFDMDGLMFDTERLWGEEYWPIVCRQLNVPLYPAFIAAVRGTAGQRMLDLIHEYYGADFDAAGMLELCWAVAAERMANGVPEKPGLHELLDLLRARKLPCAVASSSLEDAVRRNLCNQGVDGYFSAVVTGDMVARSKPDPDIFLLAAQKLQVDPAHCLVLEDSYNGIRAGHAAGMITVMVPDLMEPNAEMASLYTACYDSLLAVRDAMERGEL